MIYVPGVSPGIYKGLTSAVDLMPTVLDIMGQEVPPQVEGQSVLPRIKDTKLKGRDSVVSSAPFANPPDPAALVPMAYDQTVTTEEWSLLYSTLGPTLLYHLPSDPKQEKNVINERPEIARELHQTLVKFMREHNVPPELIETRLELKL